MNAFIHYMYVVECADGTLYTGYAVDVESRVATHNAGKGAKYTRTRTPVNLLAKARFFTKQRAMSAEAYFKQLTRDQKDALLARAAKEPFEQVLQDAIPAFGKEPIYEWVARMLCENQDEDYSQFMAKLMPSVDPKTIIGVRTPALRKIAKQLAKRSDIAEFYAATPHKLFEENQLHSFSIDSIKDYDLAIQRITAFLPFLDNWATCDQLPNKILKTRPQESLPLIYGWIDSDHIYTARYGIQVLMQHYLDELFEPHHLELVANKRVPDDEKPQPASDAYYMSMMRAWYFAEAMAKQPEAALPYLLHPEREGNGVLDEWTRRKAIQKSVESYRVTPELKELLKANRK